MNKEQKEIIKQLKEISERLKHSIKRRDCPYKLYIDSVRCFGSFNKAKEKANLITSNNIIINFKKDAFKKDGDLAQIASYITFDGHLYDTLRCFYFSSKHVKDLKKFEKLIKKKFGIFSGKYYLDSGGQGKNKTHKYIVFNKKISQKLFKLGVPKGDKVNQAFKIPRWIFYSKPLSKEYLKIAFFCEGCFKESKNRTPRIAINLAKTEEFIADGINFMEDLKKMLKYFNIRTTKCYVYSNRIRKRDNKISRDIKFRIKIEDNNRFINKIGWIK
ncbi:MAG: hypothetical protein AABW67_01450 [Nanoarchaeota archaeon]